MYRKHIDFVSSILLMALSIFVLIESYSYYQTQNERVVVVFHQSAGFFPIVIGSALLICSILLFIRSVRGGAFKENFVKIKEGAIAFLKTTTAFRALVGCIWMGIYVFVLLQRIGFAMGTPVFLVLMMTFLQFQDLKEAGLKRAIWSIVKYILISVGIVGFTYVLFQVIFRVPLP